MSERARRLTRATRIELERDRDVPVRTRCHAATVVSPTIRQLAALDWTLAHTSTSSSHFDSAPPPSLETTDPRDRRHEEDVDAGLAVVGLVDRENPAARGHRQELGMSHEHGAPVGRPDPERTEGPGRPDLSDSIDRHADPRARSSGPARGHAASLPRATRALGHADAAFSVGGAFRFW